MYTTQRNCSCSNPSSSVVPLGTDNSNNSKAGSISYATTTVSKTTDGTVTYASSKTDVATVNETTGEVTIVAAGETVITATVADSDTYTYATKTASYTLTVTGNNTLTFRGNKNAVVAGDIGVCVDTSFMINLVNERMTWNAADEKYPDTDGWDLPTRVQLKAVYDAMTALNTTLARITGANTLIDNYYWTSETYGDTNVWDVDLYNGNESHLYYKTDSNNVRLVRALD